MKSDPSTALAVLLTADESALVNLRDIVDALITTRRRVSAFPRSSAPATVAAATVPRVSPIRPPRAGSLRSDVHEVLRRGGQMNRSSVIDEVARIRADAPRDYLASKVGDVLNNANDPQIRKISRGIFAYVH